MNKRNTSKEFRLIPLIAFILVLFSTSGVVTAQNAWVDLTSKPTHMESGIHYQITYDYSFELDANLFISVKNPDAGWSWHGDWGQYIRKGDGQGELGFALRGTPTPGDGYIIEVAVKDINDETYFYDTFPLTIIAENRENKIHYAYGVRSTTLASDITIDINYTATEAMDILVELLDSENYYIGSRISVEPGRGLKDVNFRTPVEVDNPESAFWTIKMVPPGGEWYDMIDEYIVSTEVVEPIFKKPFATLASPPEAISADEVTQHISFEFFSNVDMTVSISLKNPGDNWAWYGETAATVNSFDHAPGDNVQLTFPVVLENTPTPGDGYVWELKYYRIVDGIELMTSYETVSVSVE